MLLPIVMVVVGVALTLILLIRNDTNWALVVVNCENPKMMDSNTLCMRQTVIDSCLLCIMCVVI